MTKLVPLHCLVITVGTSPADNIVMLEQEFPDYDILDVEQIRYELCGDDQKYDIDSTVFSEIHRRTEAKLRIGERVVINAANIRRDNRVALANIGIQQGVPVFYLVCDNVNGSSELKEHFISSEKDILRGDGLAEVIDMRISKLHVIKKLDTLNLSVVKDKFSGVTVIGDIHGMYHSLLAALDWARSRHHFVLFLGDIVDYGPGTLDCADEVYRTIMRGNGEMVLGNHERKIARWIDQSDRGRHKMRLSEGNRVTTQALINLGDSKKNRWMSRFRGLVARSPFLLKLDNYIFTHAAVHQSWWSGTEDYKSVENFSLFGEFEPSSNPFSDTNKPHRTYSWVDAIPSDMTVMVGHDARSFVSPLTQNNENGGRAIFMDTGSGKGGCLSSVDLRFTPQGIKLENFNRH